MNGNRAAIGKHLRSAPAGPPLSRLQVVRCAGAGNFRNSARKPGRTGVGQAIEAAVEDDQLHRRPAGSLALARSSLLVAGIDECRISQLEANLSARKTATPATGSREMGI